MKKHILTATFVLLTLSYAVSAQSLRGSYFFETSIQRNKLNPAFTPKNGFVTIPALGDIGIGSVSNVGLSNFFFPKEGKLLPYLNKGVTLDEFKSGIPDNPFENLGLNLDVLGLGFSLGRLGYLTIDASVVGKAGIATSKDLFLFPKQGMSGANDVYDLGGTAINLGAYSQLSVGYSTELFDGMHLGARVKFLMGVAGLTAGINQGSKVNLSPDNVSADLNAEGYMSGLAFDSSTMEFDLGSLSPMNGFGVAFDLGAEYRMKFDSFLISGLNLSAAVNDIGGLTYKNGSKITAGGAVSYKAGTIGIGLGEEFSDPFKEVKEQVDQLIGSVDIQKADGFKFDIVPSIYAGVEVPFLNEMVSLGLLYSNVQKRSNLTAALNFSPFRWFNLGANCTFVGPAKLYGAYIELIPKAGIGLFLAAETSSFRVNSWMIPVDNLSFNARTGLNIVFGGK